MLRIFYGDIMYNVCGEEVWKLLWVLSGILVLDFDPTLHLTLIGLIGWLESIFCNSFLFLVVLGAGIAALSATLKTILLTDGGGADIWMRCGHCNCNCNCPQ